MIFPETDTYNPECDIQAVEPFGFIDLKEAYVTHTVPTMIDEEEVAYNEIDDPSAILGKPSDVFEAYRMQEAVISAIPKEDEFTQ